MDWKILKREESFSGFFKLISYRIEHALFAGGTFRAGVIHTDQSPWLLEFIAGMVEEGESSEQVVIREAVEEAGITLDQLHFVSSYFPSPGGSAETIDLYWATTDLSGAGGLFGLETEGEDIRSSVHSFDEAMKMLDDGKINNSVTMLLLLWFDRYRRQTGITQA